VSAEISAMRSLVSRLRTDSLKMLKSLNGLTERNAVLERENSEFAVFKKGTEIEIDSLRNELMESKNQIDIMARERRELEGKIYELTNSGDLSLRSSVVE
jgi:predicted RNase H-like nuclease (RuvC/YqgF family)